MCSCPHVGVSMTNSRASSVWDTSCDSRSLCPPDRAGAPAYKHEPSSVLGPPRGYQNRSWTFWKPFGRWGQGKGIGMPTSYSPPIRLSHLLPWILIRHSSQSVLSFRHPANVYLILLCFAMYHSWWLSIGSSVIGSQAPTYSFCQWTFVK